MSELTTELSPQHTDHYQSLRSTLASRAWSMHCVEDVWLCRARRRTINKKLKIKGVQTMSATTYRVESSHPIIGPLWPNYKSSKLHTFVDRALAVVMAAKSMTSPAGHEIRVHWWQRETSSVSRSIPRIRHRYLGVCDNRIC